MSCFICGELCRCAEPRAYVSRTILTDLDPYEDTEEQFASSVAGVDRQQEEQEQVLAAGSLAAARARYASISPATSQSDLLSSTTPPNPEAWRNEVSSRVQSYKARRRRSLGDESLSFNFESTAGNHVFLRPENEPEADPVYGVSEPSPAYHANSCATAPAYEDPIEPLDHDPLPSDTQTFVELVEPEIKPLPAPETAKLLLFPRPPAMRIQSRDELAEAVFDTPRILDAPEAMDTIAIPLADITLQPDIPDDRCMPYVEPITELPLRVAPVPQRVFAEVMDTVVVVLATGLFAMIVERMDASLLTHDKHTIFGLLLLVPAILWSMYKYIFLVHGGGTPGMQLAQLRLVDFDGQRPLRMPRRYRALSMLVSIFPLGLGLLWSFVDPDKLCWHDRISRTYMTAR